MDSNITSGRRLLASESVLREGIELIPKWQSLRASACREAVISRKESKTHDDRIEHDNKMGPAIKTFYVVFATIFTTNTKDC